MIAADDGRLARFPLPWLSAAPTGGASSTESADYHGPGRGVANASLALLHAHRVTGDARFADKAEALVRRVIHPDDDIASLHLLEVERRWSYTVCLQALGRYLWVHEARGTDARWNYARACLLHYARWMAEHEYCYLDKPEVLEFPTETWAAQDIRKSEVRSGGLARADGRGTRAVPRAGALLPRAVAPDAGRLTHANTDASGRAAAPVRARPRLVRAGHAGGAAAPGPGRAVAAALALRAAAHHRRAAPQVGRHRRRRGGALRRRAARPRRHRLSPRRPFRARPRGRAQRRGRRPPDAVVP
jgi:hypothetical protein